MAYTNPGGSGVAPRPRGLNSRPRGNTPDRYNQNARAYAQQQLASMRRLGPLMGEGFPDLQGATWADPTEGWRAVSKLFAGKAREAGYADPRAYRRALKAQLKGSGGKNFSPAGEGSAARAGAPAAGYAGGTSYDPDIGLPGAPLLADMFHGKDPAMFAPGFGSQRPNPVYTTGMTGPMADPSALLAYLAKQRPGGPALDY